MRLDENTVIKEVPVSQDETTGQITETVPYVQGKAGIPIPVFEQTEGDYLKRMSDLGTKATPLAKAMEIRVAEVKRISNELQQANESSGTRRLMISRFGSMVRKAMSDPRYAENITAEGKGTRAFTKAMQWLGLGDNEVQKAIADASAMQSLAFFFALGGKASMLGNTIDERTALQSQYFDETLDTKDSLMQKYLSAVSSSVTVEESTKLMSLLNARAMDMNLPVSASQQKALEYGSSVESQPMILDQKKGMMVPNPDFMTAEEWLGLKVKPKNYNQTELLGHLYKNSAFQSVSTEVSDLDTQNMHNDIAQFVQSYANVADLQYNSNFLDKQTFKHEKTLDSYIFTELMLQFTNNNTVKFRVDGEYVTVINTELTSKYIYFNDNKNKRICKFLSKNMHPAYLESFLEQMHIIKIDSEQYFYNAVVNNTISYDADVNAFMDQSQNFLNTLVKGYKKLILNNVRFNLYEFLEDDLESVILNRITKAWHYAHEITLQTNNPSKYVVAQPLVIKYL